MKKFIKATIIDVIVALLVLILIIFSIYMCLGQTIEENVLLINQVAIKIENTTEQKEMEMNENNRLQNYPEYGTQYATIEIPKIEIAKANYSHSISRTKSWSDTTSFGTTKTQTNTIGDSAAKIP